MSDIQLEELEKRYLDHIVTYLVQDLRGVIDGINSRIRILKDWKLEFLKTKVNKKNWTDLDSGSERIFHHYFSSLFKFPNSCPIGSDLMYVTPNAIIHIEVKTCFVKNTADYKGKIPLGRNQLSYSFKNFLPHLPAVYNSVEKPTLTYAIQIVHEQMSDKIYSISVICIPNAQLLKHYGNIFLAGKTKRTKGDTIRYDYKTSPYFILLKHRDKREIFRIEVVALEKNFSIRDLTGRNFNIAPWQKI